MQTNTPEMSRAPVVNSVATLLRSLIDYAGLFPPASLAMTAAVENYHGYSRSAQNWILGRFIVPVGRLGEFERTFEAKYLELPFRSTGPEQDATWPLSALLGGDVAADLDQIREFNDRLAASSSPVDVSIQSVEVKVGNPKEVESLAKIIPPEFETYFEIPLNTSVSDCIVAVAHCGRRAKIRTGGETADKFPAPGSVIEFMRLCAELNVPFKATAGLHHPLRSVHRFTYEPSSPAGMMHGFLNVFLAAAFLRTGMEPEVVLQLLREESASAFHFDSEGAIWRDHRLSLRNIAAARERFAISFGSCSFIEPVSDLRTLHLL